MMEGEEVMEGCLQDNLQRRAIWTKKYKMVYFLFAKKQEQYIMSLHENELLNDLLKCQLFIFVYRYSVVFIGSVRFRAESGIKVEGPHVRRAY